LIFTPPNNIISGEKYRCGANKYRYGFNGKEKDDEGMGGGSQTYDYGFRIYNPSLAKFLSVDPLSNTYPWYTPYQFAGNNPIKFIDLDGLEPSENPESPENQDDRDPTSTIKSVFEDSGGDTAFEENFVRYYKGTEDPNLQVGGLTSKPGYTSDSAKGGDVNNVWVNSKGALVATEYVDHFDTKELCNFLLGCMIKGVGPENIIFPKDGKVSSMMKDSFIVNTMMSSWYELNEGKSDNFLGCTGELSGNLGAPITILSNGIFHPETFIGSAQVTIVPISSDEVLVTVFNVTSLTSGDFDKHMPWNDYPDSVVRDPEGTAEQNAFGNISQTYSFTLKIDKEKLK
jgi:RHS repeat-associated protein